MTTLAANKPRTYELNEDELFNDIPVIADDIIYDGAAVGNDTNGRARPFADGDAFMGFAVRKADNAGGAAGAINVRVAQRGSIKLVVAGVDNVNDVDKTVYATDDDTFSLTDSGSDTPIGKVRRVVDTTNNIAIVRFEAKSTQSL